MIITNQILLIVSIKKAQIFNELSGGLFEFLGSL